MNAPNEHSEFDVMLSLAFPAPPDGNFNAWKRRYPHALDHLKQPRFNLRSFNTWLSVRNLRVAAALLILAGISLWFSTRPGERDFSALYAQTALQITKAKSITWKTTYYLDTSNRDGDEKWVETSTREFAFLAPGLYRDVTLDDKGKPVHELITDLNKLKELSINHKTKTATLREKTFVDGDLKDPFHSVTIELEKELEWLGTQELNGRKVNIFRRSVKREPTRYRGNPNLTKWSLDIWIDAETKQLVRFQSPGTDLFDPEAEPNLNNPPPNVKNWRQSIPAVAKHDINFNAKLDVALFSLKAPTGYTLKHKARVQVTEQDMIQYIGVLTEYSDNTFPEHVKSSPISIAEKNRIYDTPKAKRTPLEQKLLDTVDRYKMANLFMMPVSHFLLDHVVEGSWQYIGKGVKLGDKSRIICWYKLRDSGKYRAIYGDLSVKDIDPKELPLKVTP